MSGDFLGDVARAVGLAPRERGRAPPRVSRPRPPRADGDEDDERVLREQGERQRRARDYAGREAARRYSQRTMIPFGVVAQPFVNTFSHPDRVASMQRGAGETLSDAWDTAQRAGAYVASGRIGRDADDAWRAATRFATPENVARAVRAAPSAASSAIREAPRRTGEAFSQATEDLQRRYEGHSPAAAWAHGAADSVGGAVRAMAYGPWADEERAQRRLDFARAMGDADDVRRAADEANEHALNAGINLASAFPGGRGARGGSLGRGEGIASRIADDAPDAAHAADDIPAHPATDRAAPSNAPEATIPSADYAEIPNSSARARGRSSIAANDAPPRRTQRRAVPRDETPDYPEIPGGPSTRAGGRRRGRTSSAGANRPNYFLPDELAVGKAGALRDAARPFDDLSPHHIPSAKHMARNYGVNWRDGVAVNVQAPRQGGGRHRATFTFGSRSADTTMKPRDALAAGVWDLRQIYREDSIYDKRVREALRGVIDLNRTSFPSTFRKPKDPL